MLRVAPHTHLLRENSVCRHHVTRLAPHASTHATRASFTRDAMHPRNLIPHERDQPANVPLKGYELRNALKRDERHIPLGGKEPHTGN